MRKLVIFLVFLFIGFSILHLLIWGSLFFFNYQSLVGSVTGSISFVIEKSLIILIDSPQNTTYNFSVGDVYTLNLNVSSKFDVNTWRYTLHDLRHNLIVNNSVIFTPNSTIIASRWDNNLTVFANDSTGAIAKNSVTFFVMVPNSAPVIENLSAEYFACEGSSFSKLFNASDFDEDNLTSSISPSGIFFVTTTMTNLNLTLKRSEIFSGTLGKSNIGTHRRTISVSDGNLSDSKTTNLTVIEINHAPSVSAIGVQTIYSTGDNSSFSYQVQVNDSEHGEIEDSGNFTYVLTFLSGKNFLSINTSGYINGTANSSLVGVHNISICVNDTGLSSPHANISNVCGTSGGSLSSCVNFSITVTDNNRAPTITSYSPSNLIVSVVGNSTLVEFNVTKRDPDATIPDTHWYFDEIFKNLGSGSSTDSFSVLFSACTAQTHRIKAEITDGILNDSIQWNITVSADPSCATATGGGGGGGGGGGAGIPVLKCIPKWGCSSWYICNNLEKSLKDGKIVGEDYREVKDNCINGGYNEISCGYQDRLCSDVTECKNNIDKPSERRGCFYTEAPSCSDGIENCHDGDCEVLVDCGGPCSACPTCSDNLQNQGEEGVDCGGPCSWTCEVKEGRFPKLGFEIYLAIIFIIMLIFIITMIIRALSLRKKLSGSLTADNF